LFLKIRVRDSVIVGKMRGRGVRGRGEAKYT